MFRDDSVESPAEKANRLGLILIPKRSFWDIPKEPAENKPHAVCGECGDVLKKNFTFTCKNMRCPVRPVIQLPEKEKG